MATFIMLTRISPDAVKVGALIRAYGHAHSEIWAATEWTRFKQMLHELPRAA